MSNVFRLEGVGADFRGGTVQAVDVETGARVTLALTPSDVYQPSELPEFLAGYRDPQYRAGEMSPVVLVDKDSDYYRTFSENNAFEPVNVKTSLQGAVREVDAESSTALYTVVERAIGSFIAQQTEMQAAYDAKAKAGQRCKNAIDMDIELDVMALLGTHTNWDTAVRTAAANAWDTAAGTPIVDLQLAIRKSYQGVKAIWFPEPTAHAFINHDDTKDYMRQTMGDNAVTDALKDINRAAEENIDFKIPGFPVMRVVASKYLLASTLTYTLGKVAVLISGPATAPVDGNDIMSSATFRRKGPSGTGFQAREYRVEGRGPEGGTMIVVSEASDHVMMADKAGGIITNATT
jgi:hypothetical protein